MHLLCCCGYFFFFFKQKTAYEMRISDWSSDVCSSDLLYLLALQVEFLKQLAYGFSADAGGEGVLAMLVLRFHQLVFVEKLELGERRQAGFDDDIVFKIEDALKVLQRDRKSTRLNSSH